MAKVTDDERQAIIATLRETESIGETARRHQRAKSTISGIAKTEGLTVADRSATKTATAAKAVDNDARIEALLQRTLGAAEREFDRVEALERGDQYRLVKVSAGQVIDRLVTTAPEEDRQRMYTVTAILIDKAKVLRSMKSEAREGKTLIEQFVEGLADKVAEAS